MAGQMDAGGRGGVLRRGLVAEAKAAILPDVRRLIEESIGRIAVRANGNLAAIGIRSALMFDPAATAVVDDPDREQVIIPLGGALSRCSAIVNHAAFAAGIVTLDLISTQFDPDGWADLAANTITVPDEGDYLIHAFISWGFPGGTDPTSGSYRQLSFTFSGAVQPHFSNQDPPRLLIGGDQQTQDTTTFRHLPAGTVIQVKAQHDATGPMIVSGGSSHPNDLTVVKLG